MNDAILYPQEVAAKMFAMYLVQRVKEKEFHGLSETQDKVKKLTRK